MAVMFFKIATVASLFIICAASPLQPLYNSKQAVSSQSYVRHDVPLSYKYSAVHVYTTEKTDFNQDGLKLQYAPLYLPEELKMRNDLNTKLYHESDVTNQNRDIRKDHLEPKEISGTAKTHSYISYNPGHNIELLQSVNRSPGHNTDYRNHLETTSEASSKSTEKINYHRAFSVFKMPQNDLNPSPHSLEATGPRPTPYDPSKQYNRKVNTVNPVPAINANIYQKPEEVNPVLEQQLYRNHQRLQDIHELTKQIEAQRLSTQPKLNTLLLNLARVYNAHAPLNNYITYLDNTGNQGQSLQSFVKGPSIKLTSDHVSRLIPVRVGKPQLSMHGHQ